MTMMAGAFTGEMCIEQMKDMGITNVLIGHSERRGEFGIPVAYDTNESLATKLKCAPRLLLALPSPGPIAPAHRPSQPVVLCCLIAAALPSRCPTSPPPHPTPPIP